ncbi:MAG: quinone-dependent dihydroorotate dehydrogenase, partial [Pseudohongiellaceae bacterium]
VPLLLKIAPDISVNECGDIAQALLYYKMDGVIATNTTVSRNGVEESVFSDETGGLSGSPMENISVDTVRNLKHQLRGVIPIIGVGGIHDYASAERKYKAGANLLQLYTGFIYRGPELITEAIDASVAD